MYMTLNGGKQRIDGQTRLLYQQATEMTWYKAGSVNKLLRYAGHIKIQSLPLVDVTGMKKTIT
jgi:hypothetical protein